MDISKTEARRHFIINIFFYAIVLGILYLAVVKALPLIMPFIIAFIFASVLQRPIRAVHKKIPKLSKGLIGGIFVTIVLIVLIGVIVFAGIQITSYVTDFVKSIAGRIKDLPAYLISFRNTLIRMVENWPEAISSKVIEFINKYMSSDVLQSIDIQGLLTGALGGVWGVAKNVPSIAFATIISIISCYFMVGSYDNVIRFISAQFTRRNRTLVRDTKHAFSDTICKYVVAYLKIICITFIELLISLSILKLCKLYNGGYIIIIALVIAVVDILPVLGTGSIVAPWAVYCFIRSNIGLGIGLLVMWAVISVVRQYIEPKLVGKQVGLNPLVTIMGMYIGLKLLGAIGMFLVPISIIVIKALQSDGKIKIWNTPEKTGDETQAEEQKEPEANSDSEE